MSLPRELSLAEDGSLEMRPVPELETIRAARLHVGPVETVDQSQRLAGADGDALEIVATVEPGEATLVTIGVRETPDGAERTRITVDLSASTLRVDVSSASLDEEITYHHPDVDEVSEQAAPIRVTPGANFDLRIFVDRSIVEVFYNASQAVAQRVYPTRSDALCVSVGSAGRARFTRLDVWSMHPTNHW